MGSLPRSALAFRCEGAVPEFRVHRRGDGDPVGVHVVCRGKEKAMMRTRQWYAILVL